MTFTRFNKSKIKSLSFYERESNIKLIVHGQGIITFRHEYISGPCVFSIGNATGGLRVEFTESNVLVFDLSNNPLLDKQNSFGLSKDPDATYWFSIDSQNQTLYAGIGEARIETAIYTYAFSQKSFKTFLESLTTIQLSESITPIRIIRDPITQMVPLIIKDTDDLTMNDIASTSILPSANLSPTSQILYNCISGRRFILDDRDFPDFSKAIEYSIVTPGYWCNTTLINKAREFSKDKPNLNETYLRITLGKNNGESPGVPYVMEIWPSDHYSPVHNHGGADAVIRVLHGSIQVRLFPYLSDKVVPFDVKDFKKDDITWISPTLNQVHQLKNTGKDTCITIQCYMYEGEDRKHYDYFDYIDGIGTIQQYEPDSDMDFIEFKALMKREWAARPWFNQMRK